MSHFFIQGADGQPHQILIMDVIGNTWWEAGITAKEIVQALASVDENDECKVRINCRGGNTDDGTVIYNAFADRPGKVTCIVEGYASSMATVIMCAGDTTQAYETSLAMVHKASTGVWGNSDELRATAEMLDKVDDALSIAYARKMGVEPAEAKEHLMGDRDLWKTAAELEEMGLVDEVVTPQKFAVLLNKSASAMLGAGEGAALIDPDKAPKALLPHIEGVQGVMAVRVGADSVDVTKIKAQQSPVEEPEDDPEGTQGDPDPDGQDSGGAEYGDSDGSDAGGSSDSGDGEVDDEPEPEPDEVDPATAERDRISGIMAAARKASLDLNSDFVTGLIENGIDAVSAGQQIHAVSTAFSGGSGIQSPAQHATPAATDEDRWAAAGQRAGVNKQSK